MIFIRHHESCGGKPNRVGRLAGACDCKTAPLDTSAREQLKELLGKIAQDSIDAGEEPEYFALRLDALSDQVAQDARGVRLTAKRTSRTARRLRAGCK